MARLSQMWRDGRTGLLDVDRAESAFALLFSFVRDGQYEENETFDTVLREMLRGLSVPTGAREKLQRIYQSVEESPRELPELLTNVTRDFGDDPELLVSLVRLMLRLSADEGLLSRRHIADLRETLRIFALPLESFDECEDEEKQLLSFVLLDGRERSESFGCVARELQAHYHTLGCQMDASDDELRRAYRRLAKRYHPDSVYAEVPVIDPSDPALNGHGAAEMRLDDSSQNGSTRDCRLRERARRFQAVQHAYEVVRRSRGAES